MSTQATKKKKPVAKPKKNTKKSEHPKGVKDLSLEELKDVAGGKTITCGWMEC